MKCELCSAVAESIIWRGHHCRVIYVQDANYPGFCRVIWNEHIKEMTDLSPQLRNEFMNTVFTVESAVREIMQPDKINLASLGNVTPHLHWHVIPRFIDDKHYPNPIWGKSLRETSNHNAIDTQSRLRALLLKRLPV